MARNRTRRGRQPTSPVHASPYPAVVPIASLSTPTSTDDAAQAWVDPAKPRLRAGYRVPQTGVSRRTALDEGLAPTWRIHAAHDAPHRLRSESAADAFSVHLLTNDDSWAVLVITNSQWIGERNRHGLLESHLYGSPTAPTLGGLVGHFTGEASPLVLAPRVREKARLDALDLLLGCEHPDRASVEFMVAMSGLSTPVDEWRTLRAKAVHTRSLNTLITAVGNALGPALYQPGRVGSVSRDLTTVWGENWDKATHSPTPDYLPAARAVLQRHLGNTLDDVLDDLIATTLETG